MTVAAGNSVREDRLGRFEASPAPAVVVGDRVVSYAELDEMVQRRSEELGSTRKLVLLECANELEPLVTYLAALRGHHPVLLLPALKDVRASSQWQRVIDAYQPDLICTRSSSRWVDTENLGLTRHDLHPDLAVLLGTSGSTGTPKLVRLSRANLLSNAAAIATSLGLDPTSRAATTLPMQYCYGLSVVNSHLYAGGSIWLTDASVADSGFWDDFDRAGATSLAGVPYTFELLERSGIDWLAQPRLRLVTQAGGRLAPDRVSDLAGRAAQRGIDFVVMYGQTEATARMAYLPPTMAVDRPACVGVPIDGGDLRLDDGELIYSGPNVMLGYAEDPSDLALGATLTELRTGDLAIQHDDGLFEIVGRANRIAKIFGVRVDLDLAERLLDEKGIRSRIVCANDQLHVFVTEPVAATRATDLLRSENGLPSHALRSHVLDAFPMTASGKPDLRTLEVLASTPEDLTEPSDVRSVFVGVFDREISQGDSFVSLRGDSLSYVETYTRLESLLGTVPANWQNLTVSELAATQRRPRRFWAAMETPLVLRTAGIVLLVGAHVGLWTTQGGAHVLLALLGFNMTRFALAQEAWKQQAVAVGRAVRAMLLPALVWFGAVIVVTGRFEHWSTPLMLHQVVGVDLEHWNFGWRLWFLESATWTLVAIVVLLAVPRLQSAYQRSPFVLALVALGAATVMRETIVPAAGPGHLYTPQASAWAILLGVMASSADTVAKKCVAAAAACACTLGYFGVPVRGYLVVGAVVLVLVLPRIPVPRPLNRVVAVVASASLFIYIIHWQVYPPLEDSGHSVLAFAASIAAGVAGWWVWGRVTALIARLVARRRTAHTVG